jgi:predicted metal-binding protein
MNETTYMNQLRADAVDLGASDAKIIPSHLIPVEDDVLEMCKKPLCFGFGKSINCPPHTMKPKAFREFLQGYGHALVFKIDVSVEIMMSDKKEDAFRMIYDIGSALENLAIEHGCEQPKAYAAGSCKPVFCREHDVCQALKKKEACRYPDLARPSMEAVGMNVMKIMKAVGWDIKPIGEGSDPVEVKNVVLSGLVLLT